MDVKFEKGGLVAQIIFGNDGVARFVWTKEGKPTSGHHVASVCFHFGSSSQIYIFFEAHLIFVTKFKMRRPSD